MLTRSLMVAELVMLTRSLMVAVFALLPSVATAQANAVDIATGPDPWADLVEPHPAEVAETKANRWTVAAWNAWNAEDEAQQIGAPREWWEFVPTAGLVEERVETPSAPPVQVMVNPPPVVVENRTTVFVTVAPPEEPWYASYMKPMPQPTWTLQDALWGPVYGAPLVIQPAYVASPPIWVAPAYGGCGPFRASC